MIATCYPTITREICEDFAYIFRGTALNWGSLSALVTSSLLGISSLSEAARVLPKSPSVSALSDAIKSFDSEKMMSRIRRNFLQEFPAKVAVEKFIYVVDDTPIPKSGKDMYAVGHWATSAKQMYFGQRLYVLAAVDVETGAAFPLSFRFALKEDNPDYRPGVRLAIEMLDEILADGFPVCRLVTDSWFDARELIEACVDRQIPFYTEMKSNRKIKSSPLRNIPWVRLSTFFKNGERPPVSVVIAGRQAKKKFVASKLGFIKGCDKQLRISAVFNQRCGFNVYGYFLTTEKNATEDLIWTMSRLRWFIEVMFRDLKQHFAFGGLHGRSRQDAEMSICIPFAIIHHIRLHQQQNRETGCKSRLETVGTAVARIKEHILNLSVKHLSSPINRQLRERVTARRCPDRIQKKPVNRLAGTKFSGEEYVRKGIAA